MGRTKLEMRVSGAKVCRQCSDFEQECYVHIVILHDRQPSTKLQAKTTTLYKNISELETSARDGCDICRVWLKAMVNECYSAADEKALFASQLPVRIEPPRAMANFGLFDIHIVSPVQAVVKRLKGQWGSKISTPISKDSIENVEQLKASGDAQKNSLTVIEKNALHVDLWKRVGKWMDHCIAKHPSCMPDVPEFARRYPRRLIYVDPASTTVRLFSTNQLQGKLDYVALSYCWGDSSHQTVKLSALTKYPLENGMHRSQFPLTVQHAMMACQLLRIPYLWIDALCIFQDGSGQDFAHEAKRMDEIYGFAKVTIVAASSTSAAEGFLHERKLEEHGVQARHVNFADGRLFVQRKGLPEVNSRSPVAKRAWCFQEELLARRLLYITSHGMFWSCSKVQLAEHGNHLNQSNEYFPDPHHAVSQTSPHDFLYGTDPLPAWDEMLDRYTSRDCTRQEDRLLAMYGLAAIVQRRTQEDFLFGLWRSRLPYQLLWVVHEREVGAAITQQVECSIQGVRIPTWSWASTPPRQAVKMADPRLSQSRARLLSVGALNGTTCLDMEGKTRLLLQNHARLNWPVRDINLQTRDAHSKFWAADELGLKIFVKEEDRDPIIIHLDHQLRAPFEALFCLEINYKGFLVLEHVEAKTYRRVGCAHPHNDQLFFAQFSTSTINLI